MTMQSLTLTNSEDAMQIELTTAEEEVLEHLNKAREIWEGLPGFQPEDSKLFLMPLRQLQSLIALRTLRLTAKAQQFGLV